jgi:hypothetical protein
MCLRVLPGKGTVETLKREKDLSVLANRENATGCLVLTARLAAPARSG